MESLEFGREFFGTKHSPGKKVLKPRRFKPSPKHNYIGIAAVQQKDTTYYSYIIRCKVQGTYLVRQSQSSRGATSKKKEKKKKHRMLNRV